MEKEKLRKVIQNIQKLINSNKKYLKEIKQKIINLEKKLDPVRNKKIQFQKRSIKITNVKERIQILTNVKLLTSQVFSSETPHMEEVERELYLYL